MALAAVFKARMSTFVAMLVIVVAVLLGNRFEFDFSCHGGIITYFGEIWYNRERKGGRVVEGTGLENQRGNTSAGSNPVLSASLKSPILAFFFCLLYQ